MAVRYVPCSSREHAVECRQADLLYINFAYEDAPGWELAYGLGVEFVRKYYNSEHWQSWRFAICLED